jgi:cytochrome c553
MKYILTLGFALFSASSIAAGDAEAGKAKAATCAACHGANGVAIAPIYPNLAGQKAAYMVAQLKAFKSGERKGANSALMAPMAMPLSDQDMEDISAYFAAMPAAK